jgi:hypothetical protein
MCDHCGCRQGAIAELMDQHDRIADLGSQVRRALAADDQSGARSTLGRLLAILDPHVAWEEAGLFVVLTAQGDFAEHVAALDAEHAGLSAALAAAESDPRGWGAGVVDMLDDLDAHIYRENFGLFPGAISVLDAADWQAIDAARPQTCACDGDCRPPRDQRTSEAARSMVESSAG